MSAFVDALIKVGDEISHGMGFTPLIESKVSSPQLLLVGFITPEQILKNPKLTEADIDAILISIDSLKNNDMSKIEQYISGKVWGVQINQTKIRDLENLEKRGCDFFVFEMDGTEASVLEHRESGKMLSITDDLTENMARGINDLLIDGYFYSTTKTVLPLSIQSLVEVNSIHALLDKPMVISVPTTIKTEELSSLANSGIAAISIPLASVQTANKVKKAIRSINPRKPGSIQRDALIPKDSGNQSSITDLDLDDEGFDEDSLI